MRSQSNPIQSNAIEYEQIQPGNIRARIGTVNNGELLDMPEKTRIRSHISKYEQPCDWTYITTRDALRDPNYH